jgi:hypothetical protein
VIKMKKLSKVTRQRRFLGHYRVRFQPYVEERIQKRIRTEALRWKVSESFVIANALAYAFNIPIDSYVKDTKRK